MKRAIVTAVCVALGLLTLACPSAGGGGGGGGGDAVILGATLDGGQEVPPVTTDGDGVGGITLNEGRTSISYLITASGLSGPVTAAHFHQGAAGVDGDVIIDIFSDLSEANGDVTIEGNRTVDQAFVDALLAGDIYVNLHTDANAGGEVRGQFAEVP